ncbi:MAG: transporter substrate-binding domain-containing protein, partial [Kordiimonas sp.]
FLIERLPDFRHQVLKANVHRAIVEMRENDAVCVAGLFRTPERETFMAFSKPVFRTLPNRLITMKENLKLFKPYIGDEGELDLKAFLQKSGLTAGVIVDRVYSKRINGMLEDYSGNIPKIVSPHPRYSALLQRGRIDYTFGFSYEADFQFKELGIDDAYTSISIAGEAKIVTSGVACSDREVGQTMIKAIDAIIDEYGPNPPYQRFYEEWLDEQALEDTHRYIGQMPAETRLRNE